MLPSFQSTSGRADSKVFELAPISLTAFRRKPGAHQHHPTAAVASSSAASSRALPSGQGPPNSGRPPSGVVHCFVPFNTLDHPEREYVAVGCEEGVWIGLRDKDDSYQRVLAIKDVRQLDFLEEAEQLLVLADNSLFAYPLSSLVARPPDRPLPPLPTDPQHVSSSSNGRPAHQSRASSSSSTPSHIARDPSPNARKPTQARLAPQRLSGQGKVQFFQAGVSQGRTLVIYGKRKGINECIFRCLEWVAAEKDKSGSWKLYKDFFIPSDTYFLKFLRSKIAIGCSKGVEILDLSTLQGGTIPVLPAVTPSVAALASLGLHNPSSSSSSSSNGLGSAQQPSEVTLAKLARQCEGAVPLGIGRVELGPREGEFLLVYETFGLYLSPHGGHPTPPLTPLLTWTTHATSAAFQPPNHLVLFSPNFIEVRNLSTGEVSQMLSGKNVRRCWEERGVWRELEGLPAYGARDEDEGTKEKRARGRVGVVMDGDGDGEEGRQVLYELVPILPALPSLADAPPPLLSPLEPPHRPADTDPPSPPITFGGRTENFAAPSSLHLPPLDLGNQEEHEVDYFRGT